MYYDPEAGLVSEDSLRRIREKYERMLRDGDIDPPPPPGPPSVPPRRYVPYAGRCGDVHEGEGYYSRCSCRRCTWRNLLS